MDKGFKTGWLSFWSQFSENLWHVTGFAMAAFIFDTAGDIVFKLFFGGFK